MIIRVLVPIGTYPDASSKTALGNLYAMSAMLGFKLTAIVKEVDIPPISNVLGDVLIDVTAMAAEAEQLSHRRAQELHSWSQSRCDSLKVEIDLQLLRCRSEAFATRLLPFARSHDMTAMVLDGDPQRKVEAEMFIFGSGGPVLVCPEGEESPPVFEERATSFKVMVAWDGSRGASRALRDALPLLKRADMVWIFTVDDDKVIEAEGVAGVQAFLRHHGVPSQHLLQTRGTLPIGDVLQATAVEHSADMLVMGAYGHNRLQEFVLGGATRTVLQTPQLPILFSH